MTTGNGYVPGGLDKTTQNGAVMGYTLKRIDEMEAIYNGLFRRAGAELGVESFGLQVLDMPPGFDSYPEHDHAADGQEEVYVVLSGAGEVEIDGERVAVDRERILRVPAGTNRRLLPGPEGMRVLALGGAAGKHYERPEPFKLGAPDPAAAA
jgi:mannose-6-phosphate isomerase-like protein (cupin superfamily)